MTSTHLLSRDEDWQPATPEEKLDRLDSVEQIRQLPVRYALAVDTRNLDDLVELFVPDVQIGKDRYGRDQLKQWMTDALSRLDRTIHLVANHILNFRDADHASGVVYCRDEVEANGQWTVGHLQYWDQYERRDGRWYFVRRHYNRWDVVDILTRTTRPIKGRDDHRLTTTELPQAWPSWDQFWSEQANKTTSI